MAEAKLQELIETLRQQGVQRGEEAARQIIAQAQAEAEKILGQAQAKAEAILNQARLEAEKEQRQLKSALEIAASQFVTSLKRVIEENLLIIPLQAKLSEDLSDPEFLKRLMQTFVEAYAKDPQRGEIQFILPQEAQEKLKGYVFELMARHYGQAEAQSLSLSLESAGFKFGFMVNRADGQVRLDFSDEAFLGLFLRFLAPKFRELFRPVQGQ